MSQIEDRRLVLASTSPSRRTLISKLRLTFEIADPAVDETAHPDEAAQDLVMRLALAKAKAVSGDFPNAILIGSDQVAVIDGQIQGKPGNHARAIEQLRSASGKCVVFYTGLSVLDATSGRSETICEPFTVYFRQLTEQQIETYLHHEEPYQCAGSFKSEGLGIALFSKLEGDDPNALTGLPLIRLIDLLEQHGIHVL